MLLAQLAVEKLTKKSAQNQWDLGCILKSMGLPNTVLPHLPGVQPLGQGASSTDRHGAHHLHHDFGFVNELVL